jgi:asparagine synthase (glutamine-hydrolysing)
MFSKESSKSLGLPIQIIKLDENKIKKRIPIIINTIENWNQLQVEAAIPIYCAMEKATIDGLSIVLNGQGADELFAGYDWYPKILEKEGEETLTEHMWEDLLLVYKETFERENKIAEYFNLDLRVPYCDVEVIKTGMNISIELKTRINDYMGKYIHRRMAEELGVPLSITWREKDAVQHASGIHSMLKSIAIENGYDEDKTYKFRTPIEKLGSVYRYGNKYRPDGEKYGDEFVQAYLENVAIELGIN